MLSISVNYFSSTTTKEAMRKKDCLAFTIFCTVRCNGSAVIAEIVRMMEDENLPWYQDYSSSPYDLFDDFENNFYKVLCFLADQMFFGQPGNCTKNPRHVLTNPDLIYDFEKHSDDLLKDLRTLQTSPANKLQSATKTFMTTIIKKKIDRYKGFGHVVAHDYVQMCSLLGLIPLKCYTFAAIVESSSTKSKKQTGPAKFISKCFNVPGSHQELPCNPIDTKKSKSKSDSLLSPDSHVKVPCDPKDIKKTKSKPDRLSSPGSQAKVPCDPKDTKKTKSKSDSLMSRLSCIHDNLFSEVCSNYSKEWKSKFRKDWLENALCELNRIVEASDCYKTFENNRKNMGSSILFGPSEIKKCFETPPDLSKFLDDNGSKKDTIYLYRSRPFQRQIQPQFQIVPSKKAPQLKMISHLITKDDEHQIESIELTSWTKTDKSKNEHLYWGKDDKLVMSKKLCNLYHVDMEDQCYTEPCEGTCCMPLVYGESDGCPKVYSPVHVHPMQKIIKSKHPFEPTASIHVDFWKDRMKVPHNMSDEDASSYYATVGARETKTTGNKKDKMKAIRNTLISEWNNIHDR